jgi:ferredoxin
MYSLRLLAKGCISCGICMDVCNPGAISMRTTTSRTPEGRVLTHRFLESRDPEERVSEQMMTFPYLARPVLCDGCAACQEQCPVNALLLETTGSCISRGAGISQVVH